MPANIRVVELSPLRAAALLWQPEGGSPVMTVVCKATYRLEPGVASLAEAQDDVNERDLHSENNPKLGLHSASDLVPFKPRADVTLVGRAYAPPKELADKVVARLHVGTVDKRVEVHAERYLNRRGLLRANAFFSKMPVGYERAAGGPGTSNPVGRRHDAEPDENGRIVLPNLQVPGEIPGPGVQLTPTGFGPIPATWPDRLALRGELGDVAGDDWRAHAIPSRFKWSFFNVAPPDQQLDEICADERIRLEHLHPELPVLETRLPGCWPCVYVERHGEAQRLTVRGDTLWIDTNRLVQTLTWRGQLPLADAHEAVRVLVALADAETEPSWDEVWQQAEEQQRRPVEETVPVSSRNDELRTRVEVRRGKDPKSGLTSPVPLVPSSDHSPNWLPPPSSRFGAAASSRSPLSQTSPASSGRHSGGTVFELPLSEGELRMLHELAFTRGVSPQELLRQLLHEAQARDR